MEEKDRAKQRGNPWVQLSFVVFILLALAFVAMPVVCKTSKKAPMTEATSNAKQVFYLLVEFDQDFGQFPTDATAHEIEGLEGHRHEFSNDYMAQFIQGGYTSSEEIFYARHGSKPYRKPDNLIGSPNQRLSEGECGFAYIKDLSSGAHPETPVILAPMYGDGYKFNTDAYEHKAVILRVDGSVKQFRLNKDREVVISGSTKLFDAGVKSVWGTKGFDSSKLYYANKPYDFKPELISKTNAEVWIFGGLGCLFVALVIVAVCQSRKEARAKQSKIAP